MVREVFSHVTSACPGVPLFSSHISRECSIIPESAAASTTHGSLATWEDKDGLNCQELVLSPPGFRAEPTSRDNFLITLLMFPNIKRLSGRDANQRFKAIDISS